MALDSLREKGELRQRYEEKVFDSYLLTIENTEKAGGGAAADIVTKLGGIMGVIDYQ